MRNSQASSDQLVLMLGCDDAEHSQQVERVIINFPSERHAAKEIGIVVPFLDAATISVRKLAIKRVLKSGIFATN